MAALWYDLATTKANVLAALRLGASDIDVTRIDQAIPTAAAAIEQEVDREDPLPGPPPPPDLQYVLDSVAVGAYHALGTVATIGAGAQAAPLIPGSPLDLVRDYRTLLLPYKQRWGVA